jgi:hypothetical protein
VGLPARDHPSPYLLRAADVHQDGQRFGDLLAQSSLSIPGLETATMDPKALMGSLDGMQDDVMRRLDEFASEIELTVRRLEER